MSKPKPVQTPFQQQQQTTYAPFSVSQSPEAQSLLNTPLDFGSNFNVDPGVGRRTQLAEQEYENQANSVFNAGIPRFIREQQREAGLRRIRSQGAAEAQQAEFANQQLKNQASGLRTQAELERRRLLLPQFLQTGGMSSGYNTQIDQRPGLFGQILGGATAVGSRFLPY